MKGKLVITVKTLFGLEESLRDELKELGYEKVEILNRAVQLDGTWEDVYKLNFLLRQAISVLVQVDQFYIQSSDDLYKKAKQVSWEEYFDVDKTFAVKGAVFSTIFNHTSYPYLVVKDAIVDRFRDKTNERPDVNAGNPQVLFDVYIKEKQVTLSLNTSGLPLYQRGYRQQVGEAPINEVLAAGLIYLSGWDRKSTFLDPMCGSGTIAIEAALMAADIPAMIEREHYAFKNFKSFDAVLWDEIYNSASRRPKKLDFEILASDSDAEVLQKAKRNASNAPIGKMIKFELKDFTEVEKPEDKGVLIVNPPYGERIGEEIDELYEKMGDFFKQNMTGFDCWIITSNFDAVKSVGLKPSKKLTVYNGKLECTFRKYSIFEGSLKEMKSADVPSSEKEVTKEILSTEKKRELAKEKRKLEISQNKIKAASKKEFQKKEAIEKKTLETEHQEKQVAEKKSIETEHQEKEVIEKKTIEVKPQERAVEKRETPKAAPKIQVNKSKLDQMKKYRRREDD
jgi:putative N6-adenine-specific DNA methylase